MTEQTQQDNKPLRPAVPYRPIAPQQPRGSVLLRLFLIGLLGVGAYGGYYGYCSYQAGEKEHRVSQEAQDLQQFLMRMNRTIGPEEVRLFPPELARRAQVELRTESVQVSVEPLTEEAKRKLPSSVQMALGVAAQIPGTQQQLWLVGYRARFFTRYGVVKREFESEQYTWFQWAHP